MEGSRGLLGSRLRFKPVWFDSLGAKSMCTLVEAGEVRVIIDPGAAIMHPSFPAPEDFKLEALEDALVEISRELERADVVVITHYHYDHYLRLDPELYRGKLVLAKDPNSYINDSQRSRAEAFYSQLYHALAGVSLDEVLEEPEELEYPDPTDELEEALGRSFGDYDGRRRELLERGRRWFLKRAERWARAKRIPELDAGGSTVRFADGREFEVGGVRLRFTSPLFHGIEYSRVGWVVGLTVEYGGEKLLYTSDLNGPIIEDYAGWVVGEKPDFIVLDGPMTYMLGYTLNMINFGRALENAKRIVVGSGAKLIIYDHHLPREPRFRERTREVWELGRREGVRVVTAAELLGVEPAVLRFRRGR